MKPFQFLLIISFLLTACAPRTTAVSTPPAQATVASTPSPTETPPVENTKIVPTPTEKAKTIEELAADILAGEPVDSSALTLEQQAQLAQELSSHAKELAQLYIKNPDNFSLAGLPLEFVNNIRHEIAELVNAKAQRVTFKDEAYLSNDLQMRKLEDDSTPEERKFITSYEVRQDEEGNWYYTDYKGDEHLIANFDGAPKGVITDEYSTEIKWPTTEPRPSSSPYAGLVQAQSRLKESKVNPTNEYKTQGAYTEAVILRPIIGKMYIDYGSGRPEKVSVMEVGVPVYSNDGVLLGLQRTLIIPWNGYLLLYAEGEDWQMPIGSSAFAEHEFKNVEGGQAIWLFTYGVPNTYLRDFVKNDWKQLGGHDKASLDTAREGKLSHNQVPLIEVGIIILQAGE